MNNRTNTGRLRMMAAQTLLCASTTLSASGLGLAPNLEFSLRCADVVVLGTATEEPRRVGIAYLHDVSDNGWCTWQEQESVTATTNVLSAFADMAAKYDREGKTNECTIAERAAMRYFWIWETAVSVSNTVRGIVTNDTIVVRQMLPYVTLPNVVLNEKLRRATSYILFLKDIGSTGNRRVCELSFYFVALPVAPYYPVSLFLDQSVVMHDDLIKLVAEREFSHTRFQSFQRQVPDKDRR